MHGCLPRSTSRWRIVHETECCGQCRAYVKGATTGAINQIHKNESGRNQHRRYENWWINWWNIWTGIGKYFRHIGCENVGALHYVQTEHRKCDRNRFTGSKIHWNCVQEWKSHFDVKNGLRCSYRNPEGSVSNCHPMWQKPFQILACSSIQCLWRIYAIYLRPEKFLNEWV